MAGKGKVTKKKKKPGPKGTTDKTLQKAAIKADGSPTKMGKELGITPQSAHQHLQKPKIKKAVLTARARAIKAAGLTRIKAYKQLANQLSAKEAGEIIVRGKVKHKMIPNWQAQDAARKDFLKIMGDYTDDTPTDDGGKIIPFVVILPEVNKEPLREKVDTIDV